MDTSVGTAGCLDFNWVSKELLERFLDCFLDAGAHFGLLEPKIVGSTIGEKAFDVLHDVVINRGVKPLRNI